MPGEFLNTYHFVPVLEGRPTLGPTHDVTGVRKALEENRAGAAEWGPWSHGRWHDGHLSGRITCTLTTEDPVVIGAEQEADPNGDGCTVVKPYLLEGKPAIPPTTLKGMLSAIVEAATNSAMRVLDDRALSVRQGMQDGLSALGMVRRRGGAPGKGDGDWDLIPLTLPTLKEGRGGRGSRRAFTIPAAFQTLMREHRWKPAHRVYIGHLTWSRSRPGSRNPPPPRPDADFQFMMDQGTYRADAPRVFLMDPVPLTLDATRESVVCDAQGAHVTDPRRPGAPVFLIGQRVKAGQPRRPIPEAEATDEQRRTMTRGILRVMHHAKRVADLPHTRTHEVFIPLAQDLEHAPRLPIPAEVVRCFHALADERTQTQSGARDRGEMEALPFHPCGTQRADRATDVRNALRLKDGDLVFFDLKAGGDGKPSVTAVSFSSIWREAKGSVHDYVPPEGLPLTSARTTLSPAELMFGVVEIHQGGKAKDDPNTVALKGRVRCTPARTDRGEDAFMTPEPSVRLKILASPKPPSPALYFRPKGARDGFISKAHLKDRDHDVRGRKMYLHPAAAPLGERALDQAISRTPANDPSNNQRNRVRPLKPGIAFTFHVDFDDLPPDCVDLLLFACRPTDAFRHTLGMGKALGLGRCRIDVTRIEVIDRPRRYRADDPFAAPRARDHWAPGRTHDRLDLAAAARRVVDRMDDVLLVHLLGIGEPCHIDDRPVHPPYTHVQQDGYRAGTVAAEDKTYQWFVSVYGARDHRDKQHLKDIQLPSAEGPNRWSQIRLPTLQTVETPRGHEDAGQGAAGHTGHGGGRPASGPPGRPPAAGPAGPAKQGTIKAFNAGRKFAFVVVPGVVKDVYVGAAVLERAGVTHLERGQRVAVTVKQGEKGPMATSLRLM